MGVREAVLQVLHEAGQPLHVKKITAEVLGMGLWQSDGKTPQATIAARLYADIKKNGDASSFIQTAPQTFSLRSEATPPTSKTKATKHGKAKRSTAQEYSFTNAAEKVLEQFGNKRPMHYRDITTKALDLDWLKTQGRTPEATMYAQVLSEIKRKQKRGEQPRFVQHGRGYVGLTRWMGRGLAFQIEQHNRRVREVLRKQLLTMDATTFEELTGTLLAEIGFEDIEVTRRGSDGGIDVRGTLVVGEVIRTRMAVQVKKWKLKNRVRAPVVQQVRGSLGTHEQGLIITTSDFSKGAQEEAVRANAVPVALMNGEQLVALLIGNDICITRRSHDIIELADINDSAE